MTIKVGTVTLPAYWASALVNGDFTSLSGEETRRCNAETAKLAAEGISIVSTADNAEPRFTRSYDLYDPGANCSSGDVLDYVTHQAEAHSHA